MKVSSLLPLVFAATALASNSRRSHNALAARQAQMKRGLVDVCVALDLDVHLLDILPDNKPLIAGHLDLCLCLSVLPEFCKNNPVALNVAKLMNSEDKALDFFHELVNNQTNKQQCHYPDHCDPFCSPKNPCGCQCKDGYKPDNEENPTKCTCPPPLSECNGVCGNFPHGCSSQAASHKKRAPTCTDGKTLCGVAGGSKGKGYECVDTKSDLESCGGCLVSSPFDTTESLVGGKDCSALPNVSSVQCVNSACVVSACADGFKVSAAGDACELISQVVQRDLSVDQVNDILTWLLNNNYIVGLATVGAIESKLGALLHVDTVDALLNVLLKQGLIANVANLVGIKEGLLAGIHIGNIIKRDNLSDDQINNILEWLLNNNYLVGVQTVGVITSKLGALLHVDTVDALLNVLLKQGLIANVANLVGIKEGLIAGLHIGNIIKRDDLTQDQVNGIIGALLNGNLLVGVETVGAVISKLGAAAHFDSFGALLNALVAQGLVADVPGILGIADALGLGLHVLRRDVNADQVNDIIATLLNGNLLVGVETVGAVISKIGAAAHFDTVGALFNALIAQGLVADVPGLLGVADALGAGLHIGRRDIDLGVLQGLVAEIGGILGVADVLGAGVHVA